MTNAEEIAGKRRSRITLAVCFAAYAMSQLDLALFAYAVPAIRKDFGVSLRAIGLAISAGYLAGGLIQVWLGHLTDRFGRRRLLMAASAGAGIFVALHAATVGLVTLALARAGATAFGGALYPATGALVAEVAPADRRGIWAGMLQIAYPLGWFLASLVAAPILAGYGWRGVFLVALVSLPMALVIGRFVGETPRFAAAAAAREAAPGFFAGLAQLLRPGLRRRTITLFLAQLLFVIAYGGSTFLLPTYLTEFRKLPIGMSAYLVGVGNAVSILGYLAAAYIGERLITRRNTIIIFTLLGAAGFTAMIWLPHGFYQTMAVFAGASIFFYGTAAVKFAYISEQFPTAQRATGLALCGSLAVNLGIAIGPVLITWLVTLWGWQMALSAAVCVPLLIAAALYSLLPATPSGLAIEELEARLSLANGVR